MRSFDKIRQRVPAETKIYISKALDIREQVLAILDMKGWSQQDFAKKMGKSESEISKWLSGRHNLTIKTIAKMEALLGEDVLVTPKRYGRRIFSVDEASFKSTSFSATVKKTRERSTVQAIKVMARVTRLKPGRGNLPMAVS